jgi:hypothetical protein
MHVSRSPTLVINKLRAIIAPTSHTTRQLSTPPPDRLTRHMFHCLVLVCIPMVSRYRLPDTGYGDVLVVHGLTALGPGESHLWMSLYGSALGAA